MLLKFHIDEQTSLRLVESAAQEIRPVNMQAEVILRRFLGTWTEPQLPSSMQDKQHEAISAPALSAEISQ